MEKPQFSIPELSKADLIKEWIRRADEDYGAAKLIQGQVPEYLYTVYYHCQQACEKYIRAYLVSKEIEFPENTQLSGLINKASKLTQIPSELFTEAEEIDYLVVKFRYPLDLLSNTEIDFANLLAMVAHFREYFVSNIQID